MWCVVCGAVCVWTDVFLCSWVVRGVALCEVGEQRAFGDHLISELVVGLRWSTCPVRDGDEAVDRILAMATEAKAKVSVVVCRCAAPHNC